MPPVTGRLLASVLATPAKPSLTGAVTGEVTPPMGIGDLGKDDVEQSENSDKPSVSYTYTYEAGRNEIEEWPEEKQETMHRAYQSVSDGGVVRTTFKRSPAFINLHDGMAHFYAALADALENDDWVPLLEFILSEDDPEFNAQVIQDFLDEHPDTFEALSDAEAAEAPADD